ncbi:MAG: hypothetical protein V4555_13725 [Acidobacteriota bacterium]
MVTGKRVVLGLLLLLVPAGGVAGAQRHRVDSQRVYVTCMLQDTVRSVLYLSDEFQGFSSKKLDYETSYRTMLRENYPGVYGNATCSIWMNEVQAEHQTAAHVNRISGMFQRIIPTRWVP